MPEATKVINYIPVELATLRLDTVKSFDLFMRVEQDNYVLYLSRKNVLTETDLANLAEKKIYKLYVSSEQESDYRHYVEEHLSEIVRDPAISVETKSRIVYETSTSVVEDVFKDPRTENIQRSKEVISDTVTLILSSEEATRRLTQIASHDYYTYTHSVNVCVFGVAFAKKVFPSMSGDEFQRLGVGFTLHDIGKSCIPTSILNKQGPLDAREWQLMRTHPDESARILKETGHLTDEAHVIALQHHERIDGTGYPRQLRDRDIHELAKICAVADVFDALTTNRAYGTAKNSFEALNVMKNEMYGHFSKEHFEKFVLLFAKHT